MATARPELIFVSGPQTGQRAVLMNDVAYIGRSPQADICVHEEFVSRRQVQLVVSRDGWIVENVSAGSKIRINGRKYKAGKQMILCSGDVLGLGAETELLFVDAMDNPKAVLEAYREKFPAPAQPQISPTVPTPAGLGETSPIPQPELKPATIPEKNDQPARPDSTSLARKAKYRKYAIGFGVYMVLIIGLFVAMTAWRGSTGTDDGSQEPIAWLRVEDIRDAVESNLVRSPNIEASARSLRNAQELFVNRGRTHEKNNLYLCVKNFRLYLAFRRKDRRVFDPANERQYDIAQRELIRRVRGTYDNALVAERGGRWSDAHNELEELLQYIPVKNAIDDPKVKAVIVDNVLAHLRYVSKEMNRKKKKKKKKR